MTEMQTEFCPCGALLNKEYNKRYNGKIEGFCNEKCVKRYGPHSPKNVKKYGLGGRIYGGQGIHVLKGAK